jgi:hypothetical protein
LLSDALNFSISINLKLKAKPENVPSFETLMKESSVGVDLFNFQKQKKVLYGVRYFSFLYEKI